MARTASQHPEFRRNGSERKQARGESRTGYGLAGRQGQVCRGFRSGTKFRSGLLLSPGCANLDFCAVVRAVVVVCPYGFLGFRGGFRVDRAGVAQLVEHLICNQRVGGSNPFASSTERKAQTGARSGQRFCRRLRLFWAPGLSSAVIPLRCMLLLSRRLSGWGLMRWSGMNRRRRQVGHRWPSG